MPDGDWIKALKEAGLPFFSVSLVVLVVMTSALLTELIPEPFVGALAWAEVLTLGVLLVVVTQGIWFVVRAPKKLPGPLASWLLSRRYGKLTEVQRALLRSVFATGNRSFEMDSTRSRWFEELEELGFVEFVHLPMFFVGAPLPYQIPTRAWRVLENLSRSKTL